MTSTQIKGPILLYGAGREARSTRRFLTHAAPGEIVHVCDDSGRAELENTEQVPVEGLADAFANGDYATLVRSPGVSIYKKEIRAAKAASVRVTTNVNLWAQFRRGSSKVIALTGTKGKSTTAKLIHTILTQAGRDAGLAGNIGTPVLELDTHDFVVLELSSFQCADLELNPDFIGITSLFPEHLDWHDNREEQYFADKLNILRRKKPYQCAISPQVTSNMQLPQPPKGLVHALPKLSFAFGQDLSDSVDASRLMGEHNLQNAILAARICLGAGISEQEVLNGITAFEPLPHRLEEHRHGPRTFVNDSIATNPEATKAAVHAYKGRRIALIVGGYDRDQDYESLARFLSAAPLSSIWFLPDTGHRIMDMPQLAKTSFPTFRVADLEEIFVRLQRDPDQFDVLLLSPGAPSFNQFDNFEQRGETFLALARKHFG